MSTERVIKDLLSHYGLEQASARLFRKAWNEIYHVETQDGSRYNLRLCSPTYRDKSSLADELFWLEYIAVHTAVSAPRPLANRHGEMITVVATPEGDRFSCLFAWIEGEPVKNRLTARLMHRIGETIATLHQLSKQFGFPHRNNGFRHDYCYDRTLLASHQEWIEVHQAEIAPANLQLLQRAIEWAMAEFDRIGERPENFGFIHADLHLGNFVAKGERVTLLDFDQLGRGHYGYDIATLLVDLLDNPERIPAFWEDFKAGYQAIAPLPFQADEELNPFIVAVHLAFLDWVYNSPEPQVRLSKMPLVPAVFESIRRIVPSHVKG